MGAPRAGGYHARGNCENDYLRQKKNQICRGDMIKNCFEEEINSISGLTPPSPEASATW
jgi:hypothetical protein